MGIIFRNGIPYGATESDVTSVAQYADLFDLDEKKVDHLYIVEETSKPYRYDRDTDNFVILAESVPDIQGWDNYVVVNKTINGKKWAKYNDPSFMATYEFINPGPPTGSMIATPNPSWPALFGQCENKTYGMVLKNGLSTKGNARLNISSNSLTDLSGEANLFMDGTTRFSMHDNAKLDLTGGYNRSDAGPGVYLHGNFDFVSDDEWIKTSNNAEYNPTYGCSLFYYLAYKKSSDAHYNDALTVLNNMVTTIETAYPNGNIAESSINSALTTFGRIYNDNSKDIFYSGEAYFYWCQRKDSGSEGFLKVVRTEAELGNYPIYIDKSSYNITLLLKVQLMANYYNLYYINDPDFTGGNTAGYGQSLNGVNASGPLSSMTSQVVPFYGNEKYRYRYWWRKMDYTPQNGALGLDNPEGFKIYQQPKITEYTSSGKKYRKLTYINSVTSTSDVFYGITFSFKTKTNVDVPYLNRLVSGHKEEHPSLICQGGAKLFLQEDALAEHTGSSHLKISENAMAYFSDNTKVMFEDNSIFALGRYGKVQIDSFEMQCNGGGMFHMMGAPSGTVYPYNGTYGYTTAEEKTWMPTGVFQDYPIFEMFGKPRFKMYGDPYVDIYNHSIIQMMNASEIRMDNTGTLRILENSKLLMQGKENNLSPSIFMSPNEILMAGCAGNNATSPSGEPAGPTTNFSSPDPHVDFYTRSFVNSNSTDPAIWIKGNSLIEMEVGESHNGMNVLSFNSEERLYPTCMWMQKGSFTQHSSYAHEEMHDNSVFIMRGKSVEPWEDGYIASANYNLSHLHTSWERGKRRICPKNGQKSTTFEMYDNAVLQMKGVQEETAQVLYQHKNTYYDYFSLIGQHVDLTAFSDVVDTAHSKTVSDREAINDNYMVNHNRVYNSATPFYIDSIQVWSSIAYFDTKIKGTLSSTSELPTSGQVKGDSYIIGNTVYTYKSASDGFVSNGTVSSYATSSKQLNIYADIKAGANTNYLSYPVREYNAPLAQFAETSEVRTFGDTKFILTDKEVQVQEVTENNPEVITTSVYQPGLTIKIGQTAVNFSINELMALKARLSDSRVIELTQEEYDELDPPDANTLYLVIKGNTVIQYLGNVKIGSGVAGGNTIIPLYANIGIAANMEEITND